MTALKVITAHFHFSFNFNFNFNLDSYETVKDGCPKSTSIRIQY